MTLPFPAHADLAGDADLHIRALAEAADAALSASIRLSVINPTNYSTNANGDITVFFPGLPKGITGAIVYQAKALPIAGQTTQLPPPSGSTIPYIVPSRLAYPVMINPNPPGLPAGSAWVRMIVQPYSIAANESGPWAPAEPAGNNQSVWVMGIAWGPV